ncbi:phosphonate C-P lyase system protein PhnL [Halomonas beimenensis]|uniref:Alpha-D-ribose 1-methylphosphonate 5-triphosphate synthase subunit PhnL n=1 Tax=Halomonas beimenensis TaxID=475662 RepID=A0A291PBX1_9GAMM|nr:phosphonate C-P lyase system protein PhnL [Halomonas beimenensis]ATJ84365.1 alpha-D-ribose 1-methylphosphonate 5-triphosphate synthase subunit PhnL [Halomonas beimenensis]
MTAMNQPFLSVESLDKTFVLHGQDGLRLEVMRDLSLTLAPGECLVLAGRSGIGKSTLLKMLHGSYRVTGGRLRLHFEDGELDLADLPAHAWHQLRRDVIGYVSQFLRVVPRVPAVEVVMEPLLARGADAAEARGKAEALLARLNLPERLWSLPPGTFSGGEQQRVNIARGFIGEHPLLLLDEPTASLDAANRDVVVELIREAKARGTAMLGIFHDEDVRERVADRLLPLDRHMRARTRLPDTDPQETP